MKKTTKRNHKRKGFTLVELIAVMAILGILALLVIPKFAEMTEGSKISVFENTARTLQSNVGLYIAQNSGAFPTQDNIDDITAALPNDWEDRLGTASMSASISGTSLIVEWTSPATGKQYSKTYDMETSIAADTVVTDPAPGGGGG